MSARTRRVAPSLVSAWAVGGSHGSLELGDSEGPMLAVGIERLPLSIAEIAPTVLKHFGIDPPSYSTIPLLAA